MKLTGECKKDFEKWYIPYIRKNEFVGDRYFDDTIMNQFYQWSDSMKYGVYVDFFDSTKIYVDAYAVGTKSIEFAPNVQIGNNWWKLNDYKTRPEARVKAIKKANEVYNDNI